MNTLAPLIGGLFCLLLILITIAIFRAKDVFVILQIIINSNFYALPLLLIFILLKNFSLILLAKISLIFLLNILITHLLIYAIARHAIANKINPDADFKKIL